MPLTCTLQGRRTIIEFMSLDEAAGHLNGCITVSDRNISSLYGSRFPVHCILEPGEQAKHDNSLKRIIEALISLEASRDTVLTALGGGVVCDITAFAASIYKRGMDLVLVPTTFLAMVDASVGGKTGIDHDGYKNLLGTFYPASRVMVCIEFLETLSAHEYRNGLAELLKHALLSGDMLFRRVLENRNLLKRRDRDFLEEMIRESLMYKVNIVEQDPEEKLGIRQLLNFGHTFGHALESSSSFSLTHGDAVAWGIIKALEAGTMLGFTDEEYLAAVCDLFTFLSFSVDIPVPDKRSFMKSLRQDKKRRGETVPFILQKTPGDSFLFPLPLEVVESLIL